MKNILAIVIVLMTSGVCVGQNIISISQDTTISGPWTITENTIIDGNGHVVDFGDSPKFNIIRCRVLIKNARIPDMSNWGTVSQGARLEWHSIGMRGSMEHEPVTYSTATFLDGKPYVKPGS